MTDEHDRMEELVAACALGAGDREDRALVEAHLPTCPGCRALARRLARPVEAPPHGDRPLQLPTSLRARLLAAAAAGQTPPAEDEPQAPRILTFPVRAERPGRAGRRSRLQRAAVAALAVLVIGLAAWNVALSRALDAPPPRYPIVGTGGMAAASGTVTEFRRDGAALVSLTGVPVPPAGQVYELWLIDASGRPASAGTFTPSGDGTARVGIDRPLTGVRTVAITLEDGPSGAPAPTRRPELVAHIAA